MGRESFRQGFASRLSHHLDTRWFENKRGCLGYYDAMTNALRPSPNSIRSSGQENVSRQSCAPEAVRFCPPLTLERSPSGRLSGSRLDRDTVAEHGAVGQVDDGPAIGLQDRVAEVDTGNRATIATNRDLVTVTKGLIKQD